LCIGLGNDKRQKRFYLRKQSLKRRMQFRAACEPYLLCLKPLVQPLLVELDGLLDSSMLALVRWGIDKVHSI
jgi:hypothetical protein